MDVDEGLVGHGIAIFEMPFGVEADGVEEDARLGRHLFNIDGFVGSVFEGALDDYFVLVAARGEQQSKNEDG